jgi:hypothetical protein
VSVDPSHRAVWLVELRGFEPLTFSLRTFALRAVETNALRGCDAWRGLCSIGCTFRARDGHAASGSNQDYNSGRDPAFSCIGRIRASAT